VSSRSSVIKGLEDEKLGAAVILEVCLAGKQRLLLIWLVCWQALCLRVRALRSLTEISPSLSIVGDEGMTAIIQGLASRDPELVSQLVSRTGTGLVAVWFRLLYNPSMYVNVI